MDPESTPRSTDPHNTPPRPRRPPIRVTHHRPSSSLLAAALALASIHPAKATTTSPCTGIADGSLACLSKTTFNFCVNGALVSSPAQSCASTLECCSTYNTCVFAGQCPNPYVAPTSSSAVPPAALSAGAVPTTTAASRTSAAPLALSNGAWPTASATAAASTKVCRGVTSGGIACVSSSRFHICDGAPIPTTPSLACPAGTECCTASNACVFPGQCPTGGIGTPLCTGVADNAIACLSSTTFNICYKGGFTTDTPQSCPAGTECCSATRACVFPGQCPGTPGNPLCTGIANNAIACLSSTTFNICSNG
ncbi:hypothetical protein HDU96_002639, partial [Phlyctochytrium bullatum]